MSKCIFFSPAFIIETCNTVYVAPFCHPFTSIREGSLPISRHDSPVRAHYQRVSHGCKGIKLQSSILCLSLACRQYFNEMKGTDRDRWELSVTTAFRGRLSQNNLTQAILWSITPSRLAYSIMYKSVWLYFFFCFPFPAFFSSFVIENVSDC